MLSSANLTQSTAQTGLRAVFLYLGGERRNFPRGLTEKLSPFFHAQKQEVNACGR